MKKLLPFLLIALAALSCTPAQRYIRIDGYAQGGTYTVKINVAGVSVPPEEIRDSVEAILTSIDTTLSGYNKGSQLSRLNAGETIVPNSLFRDMYALAYDWFEKSEGALDFAAGPLYDAWGFGFREGSLPDDATVAALRDQCGMKHLLCRIPDGPVSMSDLSTDRNLDQAERAEKSLSLNFNAIAQGYSCDLVAAYLYSIGVKDMLVDIGEIWCDGVNPSKAPWSVGIDLPYDRPADGSDTSGSELQGIWSSEGKPCGIVTSGNYRKYYVKDGKKYAHTVDPRSGYPVDHQLLSATIVSPSCAADADALATLCMVIGPEKAKELILSSEGIEGYLVCEAEGGAMEGWASPGFALTDER